MSAGRLAWVVLLTGVYLLSLGSLNPLDAAEGLVLATALSLGLRGRLEGPHGAGSSLAGRVAAFPLLIGGLLADVLRGTWDVTLRVVGLRPIECSGIVLVPIGERTQLGVAVTGLLAGLSPGSMLVEVDPERQAMLFHVIDAHDPDAVRDHLDRVVAQAGDPLAVGGGGGTDDVAGAADHDRLVGDDRARTDEGALTQDAAVAKDRAGHEDRAVADLAQVADAGPITWQRCPKTVRWPMATGWVLVPTTLEFSSTAEWLSIDTVASCERTTAPWARTVPAPIQAGPSSTAESAMTGAGTSGHARLKLAAHLQALRCGPPHPDRSRPFCVG